MEYTSNFYDKSLLSNDTIKEKEDYYEETSFYNGKLIQWGDTANTVDTAKLKRNNIPYEIKDDKVYIPEDAVSDATYCCT